MNIVEAACKLNPGTSWNFDGQTLTQSEDASPRVAVPTLAQLQPIMDSDTTPAAILAVERTKAITELVSGTQPLSKLQRAVLLVVLDEINVIRNLLVPSQAARTAAQFKNAVQAKINAGAAD